MNEKGHNVVWIKEAMNYYIPCQNQAYLTNFDRPHDTVKVVGDSEQAAVAGWKWTLGPAGFCQFIPGQLASCLWLSVKNWLRNTG